MVNLALDRGSRDNMSVLLADLNSKFEMGPKPVNVPAAPAEGSDGDHSHDASSSSSSSSHSSSEGGYDGHGGDAP